MSQNVVRLHPVSSGSSYREDASELLETAKQNAFALVSVIGELEDGTIYVTGTANAGETLILLHRAISRIVNGDA